MLRKTKTLSRASVQAGNPRGLILPFSEIVEPTRKMIDQIQPDALPKSKRRPNRFGDDEDSEHSEVEQVGGGSDDGLASGSSSDGEGQIISSRSSVPQVPVIINQSLPVRLMDLWSPSKVIIQFCASIQALQALGQTIDWRLVMSEDCQENLTLFL